MLVLVARERLQKIIARAGLASRRRAEEMLVAGRVRVNGRVVSTLGAQADPDRDRIEVDGRRMVPEPYATHVLYKPRGVVTTLSDPEGRRTVSDLMRRLRCRVFPVGRLDFHTAGILLLTNDGMLAHGLLQPRNLVPRVYRVKIKGAVPDEALKRLCAGVRVATTPMRAVRAFRLGTSADNTWLSVTLSYGRTEQIDGMFRAVDLRVARLTRTAFAGVTIEGMRPGDYRHVDKQELAVLRRHARLPHPRTRTVPPPPGWEETPPEDLRGEEDDGTWAAWRDGSVWEILEEPTLPAEVAEVAEGVVRRGRTAPAGAAGTPDRSDGSAKPPAMRPPRCGRIEAPAEDDDWDAFHARAPPAGPRAPLPREAPGRRPHAFRLDRKPIPSQRQGDGGNKHRSGDRRSRPGKLRPPEGQDEL